MTIGILVFGLDDVQEYHRQPDRGCYTFGHEIFFSRGCNPGLVRQGRCPVSRIRRWFTRQLSSLALSTPFARNLFQRAESAINEATLIKERDKTQSLMRDEVQYERIQLNRRMNDMLDLRRAELACVNPEAVQSMRESGHDVPVSTVAQFKERLWELELALEDRGWVRETTLAALEFSRYGVQQLIRICRIYAIKNPLVKRAAEICALYVFGRGVEIRSEDETANDAVQEFLDRNSAELGHIGLAEKEGSMRSDGALYFGLPTEGGEVTVQMVDALEIMDVIADPDDTARPWYFRRMWNRQTLSGDGSVMNEPMDCWYPSLESVLDPPANFQRFEAIQAKPVNWNMPILRGRANGSPAKWRWPVPPVYATIDWARAYKDFLEDWATVQRTLSRFALMIETEGGPGAIAAYNALLNTTFADSNGTQIEKNPPPVVGSAHISGPSNKISAFKSAGAQVAPEQARRLLLMSCASEGMPETFFGDASTGSLATAVSLDRPTELKFAEIQRRWTYLLKYILRYVLTVVAQSPGSKMREARKKDPAPPQNDFQLIVKFPNVVEHAIKDMIQAIVDIGTLGGRQGVPAGIIDRRTMADLMMAEIGVEDRDEKLDEMGYGEGYDPQDDIEDQRTQAAPQNLTDPPADASSTTGHAPPKATKPAPAASVKKAKEALVEALAGLHEARNGK